MAALGSKRLLIASATFPNHRLVITTGKLFRIGATDTCLGYIDIKRLCTVVGRAANPRCRRRVLVALDYLKRPVTARATERGSRPSRLVATLDIKRLLAAASTTDLPGHGHMAAASIKGLLIAVTTTSPDHDFVAALGLKRLLIASATFPNHWLVITTCFKHPAATRTDPNHHGLVAAASIKGLLAAATMTSPDHAGFVAALGLQRFLITGTALPKHRLVIITCVKGLFAVGVRVGATIP